MAPLVVAALAAWSLREPAAGTASSLGLVWGAAIVVFLAGVRRGLSFRTPGGPRAAELATMLWLFLFGLGALLSSSVALSAGLMAVAFASLGLLDPVAARRGEAPPFFARLRPAQMALAALASAAIFLGTL